MDNRDPLLGYEGAVLSILTVFGSIIAAVATAWFAVSRFVAEQQRANRASFLEKQFDLCFQAVDAATRIGTETGSVNWDKARLDFWRLYYGPLCIVEDKNVAKAMVELGKLIPKPELPHPEKLPITGETYRDASIRLAHATRALVHEAWNVRLALSLEDVRS